MDNFSRLTGTAPIAPLPGRVWRVQKKRKMDDRKKDQRQRPESEGDAERDSASPEEYEAKQDTEARDFEGEIGYSSSGIKKRVKRKIDLVI